MSTWFKCWPRVGFNISIETVDVSRSTDASVWVVDRRGIERRNARHTSYECFYPTWAEAKAAIVAAAEQEVNSLRMQLQSASGRLGNARGIKPPVIP